MKTTITSGQLEALLKTLAQAGATPETVQDRLSSGILAAVFNPKTKVAKDGLWMQEIALGHHRAKRTGEGRLFGLGAYQSWREALLHSKIHIDPRSRDEILGLQMPMHAEWRYRAAFTTLWYKDTLVPIAQAGRLIQAEGTLWNETTPIQLLRFAQDYPKLCEGMILVATAITVPCSWGNRYVCLDSHKHRLEFALIDVSTSAAAVQLLARSYLSPV